MSDTLDRLLEHDAGDRGGAGPAEQRRHTPAEEFNDTKEAMLRLARSIFENSEETTPSYRIRNETLRDSLMHKAGNPAVEEVREKIREADSKAEILTAVCNALTADKLTMDEAKDLLSRLEEVDDDGGELPRSSPVKEKDDPAELKSAGGVEQKSAVGDEQKSDVETLADHCEPPQPPSTFREEDV